MADANALLEVIARLQTTVLMLEAEIARLRKEIADATQVREKGVPEQKGAPKA